MTCVCVCVCVYVLYRSTSDKSTAHFVAFTLLRLLTFTFTALVKIRMTYEIDTLDLRTFGTVNISLGWVTMVTHLCCTKCGSRRYHLQSSIHHIALQRSFDAVTLQ